MASSPTSRLRFLTPAGAELAAPPEWQECFVEIDREDATLEDLALRANTLPLAIATRRIGGHYRTVGEWPLSGTGGYELELLERGAIVERRRCEVRPEKLSEEAYRQLIDDLQGRLPATVAIALQRAGALAGLRIIPPAGSTLAEELNRLRRACHGTRERAGLIGVLRALARQPHQVLRTVDVWTPRDRARRVSPSSLRQSLIKPMNLDAEMRPLIVPEQRVEHSVDTYENRLLRGYLDQVDTRLRRVHNAAAASASASAAAKAEAGALLDQLLGARRDASFLDSVSVLTEPPTRLTMVLLKRSEYRAALEGFLEFRRTALVELDEPRLQAPLTNLPSLYETWGTLQVVRAFLDVGATRGWRVTEHRLVRATPGQLWLRVLTDGDPAVRLEHPQTGRRATLYPQRTYSRGPAASGLHSISFAKKPDVSIEVAGPGDEIAAWIFDPKYKLISATVPAETAGDDETDDRQPPGVPKRLDVDAMHAYRDAIRASDGAPVVRYAATLYPGQTKDYDDGLAAIRAYPTDQASLQAKLRQVLDRALSPSEAVLTGLDSADAA
jgi:hypothetical protein